MDFENREDVPPRTCPNCGHTVDSNGFSSAPDRRCLRCGSVLPAGPAETLEAMPHMLDGIPDVAGDKGATDPPLPNQALLMSLPPAPMGSRAPMAGSSMPIV
mgnify:CR=1 FL=1